MSIYDIKVQTMNQETVTLEAYKGKALLIVNTASKCGFTPQFDGLEKLYQDYKDQGLEILGFPCGQFMKQEFDDDSKILEFCQLNYGVTFPMFHKLDVKGKNQSELFKYLLQNTPVRKNKSVKWNFEKFLVNKDGEIVNRYLSTKKPADLKQDIEAVL